MNPSGSDAEDNSPLPPEYHISGYSPFPTVAAVLRLNIKMRLDLAKTSESENRPLILIISHYEHEFSIKRHKYREVRKVNPPIYNAATTVHVIL